MRVLNCCLALVLGTATATATAAAASTSSNGRQVRARARNANTIVSNGKKAKTRTNTNTNVRSLQQSGTNNDQQQHPSSSSFVLADRVAALSPSDKHRLEQLLASGGLAVEYSDNDNNQQDQQDRRKTMKAEQSDADLYIGNNADDESNNEEGVFKPEDVTADPRELPLPTDADTGNAGNAGNSNGNGNAGVNGDAAADTAGNGNNNNDDGRWTDASDDWQMNSPFDDGTTPGSDGTGIDNNADAGGANTETETDGSGSPGGSIFDNGGGENNIASETSDGDDSTATSTTRGNDDGDGNGDGDVDDSKPTFPDDTTTSSAVPRCHVDASTGMFGSANDPESNSGLAKSTIVRYTYEVEFDLSKVERLMKALPKMENALSDALVPTMFQECAEEKATDTTSDSQLDNGWVKPPPGVEISDERDRARSTDNVAEDGLRRMKERTAAAAAMKLVRRAKEIDGVVGFSSAPEDRVVGGEPCSVLNPPVDNGCIKVEGQLTLHLAQDADDRRAVEATQDVIATTMATGDLADVDPSIIAVEYVADGLYEPATTQVTLNSSDESNQGGGGGSFPYAIAGGAAAALVGVALIGVGVKKHRNRNSDGDEDSENYCVDEMGSSIPDELNSSDEHDLGKEAAYDMAKLASPQSSHMTFDTTEISDPSTTMSSPGPVMNESALVSVNETALISTSADLGPIIEMSSNEELDADGKLGIERPYNDDSEFVGVGISQQLDDCDNHSTLFGTQHQGHGGSMAGSRSAQSGTGSLASVDGRGSILNDIV